MVDSWWVNLLFMALVVIAVIWSVLLIRGLWRFLKVLWEKISSGCVAGVMTLKPVSEALGMALFIYVFRGRLTVRAAGYIIAIEDGATPYEANAFASSIDSFAATKRMPEVMTCVQQMYGGSKLALISEARLMGYRG